MLRSAGSQSRAVGFLFPPGCSVLLPRGSTGRRRQEADHIAAPDGHPQGALDEEEEGGAGGGGGTDRSASGLEELKCHSQVEGKVSEGPSQ